MDNRPFPDLHYIVHDARDERVGVFAEWISAKYKPRNDDGRWTRDYHAFLYNLTDEAIRACPRSSEWLVVTNGDNEYDPAFLEELVKHREADAVAFDYYSRFQRPTGIPCERFAAGDAFPPCKENDMAWCRTDLAATAYRWRRFIQEDMRFGRLTARNAGQDGQMAQEVARRKWQVDHVRGRCLVEHAPSPQMCAKEGRIWDDTNPGSDTSTGGRCLPPDFDLEAAHLGDRVQVLEVEVSHDGQSFGMQPGQVLKLRCLRQPDKVYWRSLSNYFPPACASSVERAAAAAAAEAAAAAAAKVAEEAAADGAAAVNL